MENVLSLIPNQEQPKAWQCSAFIKELFYNFHTKFPELNNIDRFCKWTKRLASEQPNKYSTHSSNYILPTSEFDYF